MIPPTTPQAPTQNEVALDSICRKLQLDKTREEILSTAFDSVTSLLEQDEFWSAHETLLYAYGSRPIGTVVKPKTHEEYDLDFAIQIDDDSSNHTPESLRQRLYDSLYANGIYRDKITLIRFGVRINYKGQLHIDIMPVCRVGDTERVVAPDCKHNVWAPRNLKGYARWFEYKFIQDIRKLPLYERYRDFGLIEMRAETESLPVAKPYAAIQPLQKAVQLIKRYRNIHFENAPELATSSIILTTLAGECYDSSVTIEQSVSSILASLLHKRAECKLKGIKLKVYNPADHHVHPSDKELLSSKWEETKGNQRYNEFWSFVETMNAKWTSLEIANSKTAKVIILKELFGEYIGSELLEERSIWGTRTDSPVTYDMPHVKETAAKATPWHES
jgi:hypothetical protein